MKSKMPDKNILIPLIKSKLGNKSAVAEALGLNRTTVYLWERDDEEVAQAFKEARETIIDFAETQQFNLIKGIPKVEKDKKTGKEKVVGWIEPPNVSMIKFVLSTIGKDRGYIQKTEHDITSGGEKIKQVYILPNGKEIEF